MNYTRTDVNGKLHIHIDKGEEDKVLALWHEKRHVKYTDQDLKDRIVSIIVNKMMTHSGKWMEINPEYMGSMSMYYWGSFNVMEDERIENIVKPTRSVRQRLLDWKIKLGATKNMVTANSNPVESLLSIRFLRVDNFCYDDVMSKLGKASLKAMCNARDSSHNITMFLAGYAKFFSTFFTFSHDY